MMAIESIFYGFYFLKWKWKWRTMRMWGAKDEGKLWMKRFMELLYSSLFSSFARICLDLWWLYPWREISYFKCWMNLSFGGSYTFWLTIHKWCISIICFVLWENKINFNVSDSLTSIMGLQPTVALTHRVTLAPF